MRSLGEIIRANRVQAARELADAGRWRETGPLVESDVLSSFEKQERTALWRRHKAESKARYWRARRGQ